MKYPLAKEKQTRRGDFIKRESNVSTRSARSAKLKNLCTPFSSTAQFPRLVFTGETMSDYVSGCHMAKIGFEYFEANLTTDKRF